MGWNGYPGVTSAEALCSQITADITSESRILGQALAHGCLWTICSGERGGIMRLDLIEDFNGHWMHKTLYEEDGPLDESIPLDLFVMLGPAQTQDGLEWRARIWARHGGKRLARLFEEPRRNAPEPAAPAKRRAGQMLPSLATALALRSIEQRFWPGTKSPGAGLWHLYRRLKDHPESKAISAFLNGFEAAAAAAGVVFAPGGVPLLLDTTIAPSEAETLHQQAVAMATELLEAAGTGAAKNGGPASVIAAAPTALATPNTSLAGSLGEVRHVEARLTVAALVSRINRRLGSRGEALRTSRGQRLVAMRGKYWVEHVESHEMVRKDVDIVALGRELGIAVTGSTAVDDGGSVRGI